MKNDRDAKLAAIAKILALEGEIAGRGEALLAEQQEKLSAAGIGSKVGYAAAISSHPKGGSFVQFNSGSHCWGSEWPEWALRSARDSLLHGKQLWAIYDGSGPYGAQLLNVVLLWWPL